MLIQNLAAGTTLLTNKEIETSVQALMFDMTASTVGLADAVETLQNALDSAAYAIGTATITLTREDGSVTESLQEAIKLLAVGEMSANNKGFLRVDYNQAAHTVRVRFSVQISNDGAFTGGDKQKLLLSIAGKPTAAAWDIYALDYPVPTSSRIKYEKKYINGGVEKDFNLSGSSVMAFPVDTFTNVKLYYNNGKQITVTAEELKQRLINSEDPVLCFNGRMYYGYANYLVLNVDACFKASVLLNANDTIFNIKVLAN